MSTTTTSNLLVVLRPDIAVEYSVHNDKPLDLVTLGTAGIYVWVCSTCSYEWNSRVAHRVSGSSNCPACSKKILTTSNPELAAEWGTQNETTPDQHKPGSRERVWWICPNGEHEEYKAAIVNRRLLDVSCPSCQIPPAEKSIASVAPHLVVQWSKKNKRPPENIFANSITAVTWECEVCAHEWTTRASHRVNKDRGCPSCNNRTLEGKTVSEVLPDLVDQWSSANTDHPEIISAGSRKRIVWTCPTLGHPDYTMAPMDRRDGYGCRQCVLDKESLAALNPEIATQWHPTMNQDLLPKDVMKSSGLKVWWVCEEGHEWKAQIAARTSITRRTGCPVCAQSSISGIEAELRKALTSDKIITSVKQEHNSTLTVKWRKRQVMNVDILGSYRDQPIIVEYDGWYWHSGQIKNDSVTPLARDTAKTEALLNNGYLVVRIREKTKKHKLELLNLHHPNLLQISWLYNTDSTSLRGKIYKWLDDKNKLSD
jgi:hypothetical protein